MGVNLLNTHPLIQPVWLIYRDGWSMSEQSTIFDYAENTSSNDRKCARVIAGWNSHDSCGNIEGGVPPTFDGLYVDGFDEDDVDEDDADGDIQQKLKMLTKKPI